MTSRQSAKKKGGWSDWSEWEFDTAKNCLRRSTEHTDGRVRFQYGEKPGDPRFPQANAAVDQYLSATSTQVPEVPVQSTTIASNYTSNFQTHPRPPYYGTHSSSALLASGQWSTGLKSISSTQDPTSQEPVEDLSLRLGQSNTGLEVNASDENVRSNFPHPVQDFQAETGDGRVSDSHFTTYAQNTTNKFDSQSRVSYEDQSAPYIGYGSPGQEPNQYFPKASQNLNFASGGQSTGLYSPQYTPGVSYSSKGQVFSQYPQTGGYGLGGQQPYHTSKPISSSSPYPAESNINAPYGEQNTYVDSYENKEFDSVETLDSQTEDEDPTPPDRLRSYRRSSNSVDDVAEAMADMTANETTGRRLESNRKKSPTVRSRGASSKHKASRKQSSQSDTKNKVNTKPIQQGENVFASPTPSSRYQQPSKKPSMEPPIWGSIKQNNSSEALHPDYMLHSSSKFKKGRIFKILWSEPSGVEDEATNDAPDDETQTQTEGTYLSAKYGEKAYSSIRRFIIVQERSGHSLCLPILTYGKKATTKPGVKSDDHAIVYTGKEAPKEVEGEQKLHKRPIRVKTESAQHKLLPESRVNYAKVYTVEHNVKVCFIGAIHPDSENRFFATWKQTLDI